MELTLSNTVQVLTIVTFAAGLVKYLIVNPLQVAIKGLQISIDELKAVVDRIDCDQRASDKRLVAVEVSAKSAHKRLDRLEELK